MKICNFGEHGLIIDFALDREIPQLAQLFCDQVCVIPVIYTIIISCYLAERKSATFNETSIIRKIKDNTMIQS